MIVVLDTNVLVSGLLSPQNPPGQILDLLLEQYLAVAYDHRILAEYRDVLRRPKFGFEQPEVDALLDMMADSGQNVSASSTSILLPDEDDLPFLEVAMTVPCPLVTGNLRHYPSPSETKIPILTPSEFFKLIRQ